MRERAEQVLRQWGVPRRYVGYTYLLDMAEMFSQEEICLPRFFGLAAQRRGERLALLEARRHYAWYLKGVAHASYYKEQIVHMETLEDLYRVTAGIKRDLHD